jgi:O-antigen ligase/tetratricopeptide (TPR) repeat protein
LWLLAAGTVVISAVLVGAPLAVGGVHRPVMLILFGGAGLGLALLLAAGLTSSAAGLRITAVVALPAVFVLIPLVQSIPLPAAVRDGIDPAGHALLVGGPGAQSAFRPLSLDPPATRAHAGRAGAALAVFLAALHLASGRSRRQLLLRVVAAAGLAAAVIGLGHRMLGEERIYGVFTTGRALLNGPFVNKNHTAELLELSAFVAVALAVAGTSALSRVGWLSAAVFLVAASLGTLSRGAVLGLAVGGVVLLTFRNVGRSEEAATDQPPGRRRASLVWIGLGVSLIAVVAATLGASQLLARFSNESLTGETRFRLWLNSLEVLSAHPFGIGRGAFDRVFPVYRHIEGTFPMRFAFIENQPLQLLVDTGWLGLALVLAALTFAIREVYRRGRRDLVEVALICGLLAVLTHNIVDFGLETLGVLLPFCAVLGTLFGRMKATREHQVVPRAGWVIAGATMLTLLVGGASLLRGSSDDFDALLKQTTQPEERRRLAQRAQAAHPVDYFYVLAQAGVEPVRPGPDGRSPRLRLLNRSLILCPSCPDVHAEVARTLWALGRRSQALNEWRLASMTGSGLFDSVTEESWRSGATPQEMAVLAGGDPNRMVAIAAFLRSKSATEAARKMLISASQAGAKPLELMLLQADLDIGDNQIERAMKTLEAARKLAPTDPRIFDLHAQALVRSGAPEKALAVLEQGIGMKPLDLPLQRQRVQIVLNYQKWNTAARALEGLQMALQHARLPSAEAHLSAARIEARMGNIKKALSEYRIALNANSKDYILWGEYATFNESVGRLEDALLAYQEARQLRPADTAIAAAINRVEERRQALKASAARDRVLLP